MAESGRDRLGLGSRPNNQAASGAGANGSASDATGASVLRHERGGSLHAGARTDPGIAAPTSRWRRAVEPLTSLLSITVGVRASRRARTTSATYAARRCACVSASPGPVRHRDARRCLLPARCWPGQDADHAARAVRARCEAAASSARNLVQKTNREREVLARHWLIPDNIRLLSYDMLGRVQAAHELELYRPDVILADEVHRLKNRRAAVTRRVARFMHDHPDTRFVAMSGTIMRKSLLDFGHIVRWSLKDGAPIPKTDVELEEWAAALDERAPGGSDLRRYEPGALLHFCTPEEIAKPANDVTPVTAARRGFQRRLIETPGVVADRERRARDVLDLRSGDHLRRRAGHGTALREAAPRMAHARRLAALPGRRRVAARARARARLHYVWDPRPPEAWRNARRAWSAFVGKSSVARARSTASSSRPSVRRRQTRQHDARGVARHQRHLHAEHRPGLA